ncbi:MAG: hypothetical protein ACLSB9_04880 [Hydrogeniiclostridium mannosilyticum]
MEAEWIEQLGEDSFMNVKHWKRVGDDGALHVLGNGQMCAYEEGPVIEQVFGPPYFGISWAVWRWRE